MSKGPSATVPTLVGQTAAQAASALQGVNLQAAPSEAWSTTAPAGTVISQDPAAGQEVSVGSSVAYVVSKGKPTVPNLVDTPESGITDALAARTLNPGTRTETFHDTILAGRITGTTPAAGQEVSVGSSVAYVVSKGPSATVPTLVGQTAAQAASALQGVNLQAAPSEAWSTTAPAGTVISQDPAAGQEVSVGSSVAYVVSKGPSATVPNVLGFLEADAVGVLGSASLAAGSRTEASSESVPPGVVLSQGTPAGAVVAPGTPVDYVISVGPAPVTVAPTPTPTAPPTPAPDPAPVAVTVVVDDLSPQFVKRAGGWRQANSGYLKHNYWVPARAGKAKRIATWRPTLTAPGDYRIAVRIPSRDATTRKAVYRIKTVDGWVKHRLDQSIAQGKWVDVGTFRLTTTPAVKLTDRTGERASLGRRVGFDAIRFVPVAQPRVSSDPASPADETSAGAPAPAGPEAPTAQPAADPTPEPTKEPAADPKPEPTPEAPTAQPAADPTPQPTPDQRRIPRRTRHLSRLPNQPRSRRPSARRSPAPLPNLRPSGPLTQRRSPRLCRHRSRSLSPQPNPQPNPTPARPPADPGRPPPGAPAVPAGISCWARPPRCW